MNPEQFGDYLDNLVLEINQSIETDIPDIIGVEAVNHFKESFDNEGFTNESLQKWPEVKRRKNKTRGADAMRKILTGPTGALGNSIEYDKQPGKVVISANPMNRGADENYARIHNDGGTINHPGGTAYFITKDKLAAFVSNEKASGRNLPRTKPHPITIPKRQFIGNSKVLNQKIVDKIQRYLKQRLKL